jgi:hypothetical protein
MEEKKYLTPEEIEESRQRVVDLGVKHRDLSLSLRKVNGILLVFTIISMIVLQIKVQEGEVLASFRNGIFVLCVGALIVMSIVWKVEEKRYRKVFEPFEQMFKNQFLPGVLQEHLDKIIAFEPKNGLSRETIIKSRIFPGFDWIISNDYLHAVYKGMDFEYCDLELKEEQEYEDNDGHKQKHIVTTFKGIFIITEFDHFADTPLYLNAGGGHGNVTTESIEFNENFSIDCKEPVDALRILTPHMMAHILKIKEYCGSNICIAFFDDKIFFRTEPGRDLFEIENNIEKPIFDKRNSVIKDLEYVTGILKLLDMPNLKFKNSKFE